MGKAGQIEGLGGAGGGVHYGLMGGGGVSGHGLRDSARTRRGAPIGVGQVKKRPNLLDFTVKLHLECGTGSVMLAHGTTAERLLKASPCLRPHPLLRRRLSHHRDVRTQEKAAPATSQWVVLFPRATGEGGRKWRATGLPSGNAFTPSHMVIHRVAPYTQRRRRLPLFSASPKS